MRGRLRADATTVALAVAMCLVLGASGSAAAATRLPPGDAASVAAAPIDASQITFSAFRSFGLPIVPGESFYLSVVRWVPTGPMHFAELVDGTEVFLADASWQLGGSVGGTQSFTADFLIESGVEGTHSYRAVFEATEAFDALTLDLEVVVELASVTITVVSSSPVQTHHPVVLSAQVGGEGTGTPLTGQFEWRNADTGVILATLSPDDYTLTMAPLPVGTYRFTVTYTGDSTHSAATSPVYTLIVVPDIVDASGVGTRYAIFYPVADGYRDTVAIKGIRDEPASVAIKVYTGAGSRVAAFSVAAASGPYSQPWTGRVAGGAILPAGMYTVVQTLTDAYGSKSVVKTSVSLSHEKLVQYTKDVTLAGSALSASGYGAGGSVTASESGGYAKLIAGSGGAVAGWEFSLPPMTVVNSVSVLIHAKVGFSAPPSQLGMQNFATCPRGPGDWSASCFGNLTVIGNGNGSLAWYGTPGTSAKDYRSRGFVRGLVSVRYGTVYVYEARVRVVYQLLSGHGSVTLTRS